jgi:hypothetical protein
MSRLCGLSHWARDALGPHAGGRTAELPIINPICDHRPYDISQITPLSKGFCPSWSCAFFFPSIICQHHLNRLTKLPKHNNNVNQQPTPPHQSTCLPTSDPAAPTRPVTRYDQPTHERHALTQSTHTPQRTVSDAEIKAQQEANRFHEGKENSHKANDSSTFTCDAPSTIPEIRC